MAKLFIGCDHIDFIHAGTCYKGVLSKIILEEKTVVRIDYTDEDSFQTGRYEVSYKVDPVSGKTIWTPPNIKDDLAIVLQAAIEKNSSLLELE